MSKLRQPMPAFCSGAAMVKGDHRAIVIISANQSEIELLVTSASLPVTSVGRTLQMEAAVCRVLLLMFCRYHFWLDNSGCGAGGRSKQFHKTLTCCRISLLNVLRLQVNRAQTPFVHLMFQTLSNQSSEFPPKIARTFALQRVGGSS